MTAVESLPCGCTLTQGLVDGVETLVMRACREGCPNLAAALSMADELDRPVEIRSTETITVTCLRCRRELDAAAPLADNELALPEPGSVSICAYCANVTMYDINPDGDLYLRQPTGDELADLGTDPSIGRAVAAIHERNRR